MVTFLATCLELLKKGKPTQFHIGTLYMHAYPVLNVVDLVQQLLPGLEN